MSDQVLLPAPVGHMSEFVGGYNGDCMETALAVCVAAARGETLTADLIVNFDEDMRRLGLAQTNGATTIGECIAYAQHRGCEVLVDIGYAEPFNGDCRALLREHAGVHPILLNVANGEALRGDEATLHYHGIAVVGKEDDGYLCSDGDNVSANAAFEVYPWDMIASAQPCGMLVIGMQREGHSLPPLRTYVVQRGDSLWSIVHTLIDRGVVPPSYSAAQLYATNAGVIGPNPNLIQPGQVLHY